MYLCKQDDFSNGIYYLVCLVRLYFLWVDSRLFVFLNDKRGFAVGYFFYYKMIQKFYCLFKGNQEKVVIKFCNILNLFVLEKFEKFFLLIKNSNNYKYDYDNVYKNFV